MGEFLCWVVFFQFHCQQYFYFPVFKHFLCSVFLRLQPLPVCTVNSQEEIQLYLSVQNVFHLLLRRKVNNSRTITKEGIAKWQVAALIFFQRLPGQAAWRRRAAGPTFRTICRPQHSAGLCFPRLPSAYYQYG